MSNQVNRIHICTSDILVIVFASIGAGVSIAASVKLAIMAIIKIASSLTC